MSEQPDYPTVDEAPFAASEVIEPIHVVVDGKQEESETPEFGSWQSMSWPAGASAVSTAQPILPQARRRYEAQIVVVGVPTTTTPAVNAIALPASGVAGFNNNSTGVNVTVAGGTVSAIAVNGVTTGATSGTFFVPAGGTITVTYTVAPTTFTTAGIPVTAVPAGAFVRVGTFAQVTGNSGAQLQPGRYPYHSAQQVYVASDGVNPMLINVLDERYI
jgi:hypothetical protein